MSQFQEQPAKERPKNDVQTPRNTRRPPRCSSRACYLRRFGRWHFLQSRPNARARRPNAHTRPRRSCHSIIAFWRTAVVRSCCARVLEHDRIGVKITSLVLIGLVPAARLTGGYRWCGRGGGACSHTLKRVLALRFLCVWRAMRLCTTLRLALRLVVSRAHALDQTSPSRREGRCVSVLYFFIRFRPLHARQNS